MAGRARARRHAAAGTAALQADQPGPRRLGRAQARSSAPAAARRSRLAARAAVQAHMQRFLPQQARLQVPDAPHVRQPCGTVTAWPRPAAGAARFRSRISLLSLLLRLLTQAPKRAGLLWPSCTRGTCAPLSQWAASMHGTQQHQTRVASAGAADAGPRSCACADAHRAPISRIRHACRARAHTPRMAAGGQRRRASAHPWRGRGGAGGRARLRRGRLQRRQRQARERAAAAQIQPPRRDRAQAHLLPPGFHRFSQPSSAVNATWPCCALRQMRTSGAQQPMYGALHDCMSTHCAETGRAGAGRRMLLSA